MSPLIVFAVLVDVDVLAEQLHAQAADEALLPGFVRHFVAVGISQAMSGRLGSLDRLAVEEAAAMKDRLIVIEVDHAAARISAAIPFRGVRSQWSQEISLSWQ